MYRKLSYLLLLLTIFLPTLGNGLATFGVNDVAIWSNSTHNVMPITCYAIKPEANQADLRFTSCTVDGTKLKLIYSESAGEVVAGPRPQTETSVAGGFIVTIYP